MSDVIQFYTNPMSRGQIARWMLEESGADYEAHILDYEGSMKAPEYLAINPMGKVPAIVHQGHVVTECAAICVYLAEAFPQADLAPRAEERADYYRWMFFVAGPLEAAITNRAAGFEGKPGSERSFGYGSYENAISALESALTDKDYICGSRFTAADVYVGAQIDWGLLFKTLPERPVFTGYAERIRQRSAYRRAKEIDNALIAKMQAEKD